VWRGSRDGGDQPKNTNIVGGKEKNPVVLYPGKKKNQTKRKGNPKPSLRRCTGSRKISQKKKFRRKTGILEKNLAGVLPKNLEASNWEKGNGEKETPTIPKEKKKILWGGKSCRGDPRDGAREKQQ